MLYTYTIDHAELQRGPAPAQFLNPAEQTRMAELGRPKRRHDWLRGRYAAKQLVQSYLAQAHAIDLALAAIEIASDPDGSPLVLLPADSNPARPLRAQGPAGHPPAAPPLMLTPPTRARAGAEHQGRPPQRPAPPSRSGQPGAGPLHLSISHSGDRAFCALSERGPVGVDIERVETRAPGFAADYCTPAEVVWLEAAPAADYTTLLTAIWSAKEAALKVMRLGLTVDTRDLTCLPALPPAPSWQPITIRTALSVARLQGWWRAEGGYVFTIAEEVPG